MKTRLLIGLLLVFTFVFSGGAVLAQDKTTAEGGDYWINGVGMDGTEYSAGLEILRLGDSDIYSMAWEFPNPAYGVGLLNGNVLSAAYGGSNCIVATYQLAENGDIAGTWTATGYTSVGTETGVFGEQTGNVATYALEGTNPDGGNYEGTMTVTFGENTAQIVQETPGATLNGTGILQGSVISAVYGEDTCGVMGYQVQDGGSLAGVWTMLGTDTVSTETALPINIAGAHSVTGTNPDGSEYTGTLDVAADNQVHTFTWTLGNGEIPGVGILRGNYAAVGFGGEDCSVASFFVLPSGSLSGLWTVVGKNTVGEEFAVRSTPGTYAEGSTIPDIEGSYSVSGFNPDNPNTRYQGQLDIISHGDVYEVVWTFSNSIINGIGILASNTLMVGYGGETCGINAYKVTPDSMIGAWGVYGNDALGSETATR